MRWSFLFSPQGSVLIGSTFWGPRWLFLMGSWPGSTFFFYLSTINSQWTLNRVSCSKKEKMADGLCQWNIGIQVDRASSPFVFLNAPFYTKGVQSSLLLNFWHLFDAWIARAMQTWKIAVTGSRFMGLNFHDRHWSGCSERDRGWMNESEEVPSAFALLLI